MKHKRKSKLDKLLSSHMRLLKAFRKQTEEIGHLRTLLLEMRPKPETPAWYPRYYEKNGLLVKNVPYSPADKP